MALSKWRLRIIPKDRDTFDVYCQDFNVKEGLLQVQVSEDPLMIKFYPLQNLLEITAEEAAK